MLDGYGRSPFRPLLFRPPLHICIPILVIHTLTLCILPQARSRKSLHRIPPLPLSPPHAALKSGALPGDVHLQLWHDYPNQEAPPFATTSNCNYPHQPCRSGCAMVKPSSEWLSTAHVGWWKGLGKETPRGWRGYKVLCVLNTGSSSLICLFS